MRACDAFVFLDDVQMPSGRSYVSRCQVRTRVGPMWLSAPVHHGQRDLINQVRFAEAGWQRKHLQTLRSHYGRAPFFAEVFALVEPLYADAGELLAPFNERLVRAVAGYLGLPCHFVRSSELDVPVEAQGDDRLLAICRALGAATYVSGKGGQNYQDPDKFADAGIALHVRVYQPVAYPQGQGAAFLPGLSILDALCHLGRDAARLLDYEPLDPA